MSIVNEDPGSRIYRELWRQGTGPFRTSPLYRGNGERATLAKELWRAKHRWELGSRAALIDAIAICKEHNWPLPNWMSPAIEDILTKGLFDRTAFKDSYQRVSQGELTRLQRQKHCQVFFAIKHLQDRDEPECAWLPRLLSPLETQCVTEQQLEDAYTDSKRYELVSALLPRAEGKQRSNTPAAVEESIKKSNTEVVSVFGWNTFSLSPQFYLWDVPFLHSSTVKQLNLPYLQ